MNRDKTDNRTVSVIILMITVAAECLLIFAFIKDICGIRSGLSDISAVSLSIAASVVLSAAVFVSGLMIGHLFTHIRDESRIRQDSLKRSRAVLGGLAAEQVAPFLPDFPCNPADVRFVGKPVDFIGFPGMTEYGKVDEILLIEVKTGNSQLSGIETRIRSAADKKHIRYVEYRI